MQRRASTESALVLLRREGEFDDGGDDEVFFARVLDVSSPLLFFLSK